MLDFKKYFSGCKLTKRQRRVIRKSVWRLTDYFEFPAEIPLQIGYIYHDAGNGFYGVKPNKTRAEKFIKMSAEKGSHLGMEAYGLFLYEKGHYKAALVWLERSDTFNDSDFFEELNEKIAEQKNKATYELKPQKNIPYY